MAGNMSHVGVAQYRPRSRAARHGLPVHRIVPQLRPRIDRYSEAEGLGVRHGRRPLPISATTQPIGNFGEESHLSVSAVVSTTRKRAWLASMRW